MTPSVPPVVRCPHQSPSGPRVPRSVHVECVCGPEAFAAPSLAAAAHCVPGAALLAGAPSSSTRGAAGACCAGAVVASQLIDVSARGFFLVGDRLSASTGTLPSSQSSVVGGALCALACMCSALSLFVERCGGGGTGNSLGQPSSTPVLPPAAPPSSPCWPLAGTFPPAAPASAAIRAFCAPAELLPSIFSLSSFESHGLASSWTSACSVSSVCRRYAPILCLSLEKGSPHVVRRTCGASRARAALSAPSA
mmetsp:Transcript_972/g.3768  ORF Transcript_972/g.3768 Transcript_972/m.3768 type:complete len:251 (+) Transcript_972:2459-3211(+)